MINDDPKPTRPRYRVSGGILLGSRSKRPMAVSSNSEESEVIVTQSTILSVAKPYQVIGYPRLVGTVSNIRIWRVGPINSRKLQVLVPAWEGAILVGGCQFFIRDEYYPELTLSGGTYYRTGRAIGVSSEIVQKEWSYSDTESRNYSYNSATGAITQTAIVLTRISVVKEEEGVYYLCTLISPDDPPHNAFSFPADFDLEHPL